MSPRDASQAGAAAGADLDELVFRYLELQEQGRVDALESLCAEHPTLAEALRVRVSALAASGLLNESARDFPERIGDFRLLERLGQGGMGVVYRAEQESLKRTVALKLVRPELLYFPGARERFQREVLSVSRMSHPGIAPVFTVGEEAGIPFFAMELVHGPSLADALEALQARRPAELSGADLERLVRERGGDAASSASDARGKVFAGTWEQACVRIVQQVADALEHAHLREVLHRDVKPSNVMLTAGGRALLLDFGLSSLGGTSRLTRSGSQIGSMPYMPPEVLSGGSETIDARTDVYALGVTLYELLTLRLPFEGQTVQELMARVAAGQAEPPRRLNPSVSWEVETCCLTAMELDPARRYASAAAFARDLDNALARRPIEARRASPALRTRRFVERHPAWSVGMALGALLVIGGPLVYAGQERRRRLDVEAANERVQAANVELELALGQVSRERDEARRQFERAEGNLEAALGAVDVLLARVADRTLRQVPHMDQVRRGLFGDALAFYEDLLVQRAGSTTSIDEFEVRLKLGQLEFEFGEYSAAEQRLQVLLDELEDFERSGAGEGDDVLYLRGRALNTLGTLHSFPRLTPQGLEEMREAARILEECATGDSATSTRRATAALAMSNLGMRLWQMERPREEVLDVYERSRALRLATDRNDVRTLLELCDIDAIRARCLSELGRLPEARAAADDASAVLDSALALRPAERGARRRLVEVAVRLAFVFDGQGALEDGVALLSAARPVSEGLLRDFPEDVQVLQQSLMLDTNLAGMLTGLQRDAEAEVLLRQLIERCATQGTAAAAEDGVAQVAASARTNLSAILVQRGEFDAARTEVDAAVASYERLVQSGVQGTMRTALIRNLGGSMVARAKVNLASRALDEAGAELEAAEKHLAGHSRGEFDLAHAWMLLFAALEADPSLTRSDPLEVLDQAGRRALAALQRAVDLGWADAAHLREHAEWQPLHGTAELDALLQRLDAGLR